jgi:threonine efflux protein
MASEMLPNETISVNIVASESYAGLRLAAQTPQFQGKILTRRHWNPLMITLPHLSSSLVLAYGTYAIGTASPGPSTMAIMATAMAHGRRQAIALSAGVICGSMTWAASAGLGLATLMQAYSWSLVTIKVLGGLYMLWLSWKAARAAIRPIAWLEGPQAAHGSLRKTFLQGMTMHLTNPKAIFVWLSIMALALPPQAQRSDALMVAAGCAPIGMLVFLGYALLFSTAGVRAVYRRIYRAFNAALSTVFAFAGVRLLFARGH